MRAVQSEPQRHALDRLLVLGTLLEGHADHVMDAVGPAVVPSVATIRRRFDERRQRKQPPLQRVLRALLGIDAKISQYTRGKAFVDHVVGRVGMDRFNTIWSGPDTLPLPDRNRRPAAMDRPGAVAAAAGGCRGVRHGVSARRGPLVRRAVGRTRLAGADRRRRQVRPTTALIVDHGLQPDSAAVADDRPRRRRCRWDVLTHRCFASKWVPTADRRRRRGLPATPRWRRPATAPGAVGHTLDDQAETVLLGLGRGSGAALDRRHAAVRSAVVPAAAGCAAGASPTRRATSWASTRGSDPHNTDRRFTRARLRAEVLPLLEDVLGGGVAEALARTATALREDTDAARRHSPRGRWPTRHGEGAGLPPTRCRRCRTRSVAG